MDCAMTICKNNCLSADLHEWGQITITEIHARREKENMKDDKQRGLLPETSD